MASDEHQQHEQVQHLTALAPTVCKPCQRRKRKCDKILPSCSRCSRLLVKCWYPDNLDARAPVLPPLMDVLPGLGTTPSPNSLPPPSSLWTFSFGKDGPAFSIDDQVSMQARRLLDDIITKRGPFQLFCENYFRCYQQSIPIINEEEFYWRLENGSDDPHFCVLLLAIICITQLFPQQRDGMDIDSSDSLEELYPTLKSVYSMLQSTGRVTLEIIQIGILLASYEHAQALHQNAWLSMGSCVRMSQVLGLHTLLQTPIPADREERIALESRRRVWWAVVMLERVIHGAYKENTLPLATPPPQLDDILPMRYLDDEIAYRVRDDVLLPNDVDLSNPASLQRGFTNFTPFATIIQATYLSQLAKEHMQDVNKSPEQGRIDAVRIDASLQSYIGALIPPPGKSIGLYCGALEIRTSAAYALYQHSLSVATSLNDPSVILQATNAIQSLVRITIHATKTARLGSPIEFDCIAFYAHIVVFTTLIWHIRFGERNEDWLGDLNLLKGYLEYFAPRYRLYANCLRDIEIFERDFVYVAPG